MQILFTTVIDKLALYLKRYLEKIPIKKYVTPYLQLHFLIAPALDMVNMCQSSQVKIEPCAPSAKVHSNKEMHRGKYIL